MVIHYGMEHIEFSKNRDGRVVCERACTCLSLCEVQRVANLRELPPAESIALFEYINRETIKEIVIKSSVMLVWILCAGLLLAMKFAEMP